MADCTGLPTLETIQDFNKNAKVLNEVVTSTADQTVQTDSQGKTKKTVKNFENIVDNANEFIESTNDTFETYTSGQTKQTVSGIVGDATKFTDSTDETFTSYNGSVRRTVAGITEEAETRISNAVIGAGWTSVGLWTGNPELTETNQYVRDNSTGFDYAPLMLPYTVDSVTNPDPEALVGTELKRVFEVNQETIRRTKEQVYGPGTVLFLGDNGVNVENGDTVPAGTTHLAVVINGKVEDVAMSPVASGAVSLLTETGATIGVTPVTLHAFRNGGYQASNTQLQSITPRLGEQWFNTADNTIHMGDGVTPGGIKQTSVVNVKNHGAKGDGVTYDNDAIQSAVDFAIANNAALYIPTGRYRLSAPTAESTAAFTIPESPTLDLKIYGDGDTTVLVAEDNINHGFSYTALFGNTSGMTPTLTEPTRGGFGKFFAHDFKVEGAWRANYNDPALGRFGRNLFGFSKLDEFKVKYVTVENWQNKWSRGGFHKRYTAMFNTVTVCASDVFRAQESENVVVSFNKVKNADDDAVAIHSERSTAEPNSAANILVQGNIIEDSESILCLGGKVVNISNNIIARSHGTCLAVMSSGPFPEGQSPSHSIVIANNVITDPLVRAENGIFTVTNETQGAISVGRSFVSPLSNGDVPTRPRVSNSTFSPEYQAGDGVNFMYANDFHVKPSSGGTGVNITGNTITRTLPSGVNYNANGYGMYIDRFGEWNPVIRDDSIVWSGIVAINDINNLNIHGNVISSIHKSAIRLRRVENVNDEFKLGLTNVSITNNTVTNCKQGVATNISEATFNVNWSVLINGNTFDCDPYLKDPSRKLNGGWNLDVGVSSLCVGLLLRNLNGVTANNNVFKNCYQPIKINQTESVEAIGYNGQGNVVFCDPVSSGFNTNNKGVGNIGTGAEYTHVIYDGDPSSATYGKITTNPNQVENAAPSNGFFVQGFTIKRGNIGAGGNGDRVTGWTRVTTGDQNVLGVDWRVNYENGFTVQSDDNNLGDITNDINTNDKYIGKMVFSANRPLWADGGGNSSNWRDATGAIVITPA